MLIDFYFYKITNELISLCNSIRNRIILESKESDRAYAKAVLSSLCCLKTYETCVSRNHISKANCKSSNKGCYNKWAEIVDPYSNFNNI